MPNFLNTQFDSAVANLLVIPNDFDPDYDAYCSSYGSGGYIEPISYTEKRVTVKISLRNKSKTAYTGTGLVLAKSTNSTSTTPRAVQSSIQPSISQTFRSSDERVPSLLSNSTLKSAQVDSKYEIQPPLTVASHAPVEIAQDCECAGECSDADWCQKLDSLNAQIVAMIQEGEMALSQEPEVLDCEL